MGFRADRFGCGVLAVAAGCGEVELEVAEFAELCGVAGPVRVLEHGPDETVYYRHQRVGERLIFALGPSESLYPGVPLGPVDEEQLWTTGLCGESPTRLDDRYRDMFVIDRWPEVVLVCDGEGIHSLGAAGPLAPHLVFPGASCAPTWTEFGLVQPDSAGGLLFYPYPDDPRSGVAARLKLPVTVRMEDGRPRFSGTEDGLLVLQLDRALVEVGLRDLAVTSVQAGVGDFVASPSGRYVLSKGPGPEGEPSWEPRPVTLNDRVTGVSVGLGDGRLEGLSQPALRWGDQGLLVVGLREGTWLFRLPDLQGVQVPEGYAGARIATVLPVDPLPDGRLIVRSAADSSLHSIDAATGELVPMFKSPGQVLGRTEAGTVVLGVHECCATASGLDEAAAWLLPDDGSEATKLARRSTMFGWLASDGSFMSIVGIDSGFRGELTRSDPVTGETRIVDDRVYPILGLGRTSEADIVRYSVQDGERSGIWQVRLAR